MSHTGQRADEGGLCRPTAEMLCGGAPDHACICGWGRCTHSLRGVAGWLQALCAVTMLCHTQALHTTSGPPVLAEASSCAAATAPGQAHRCGSAPGSWVCCPGGSDHKLSCALRTADLSFVQCAAIPSMQPRCSADGSRLERVCLTACWCPRHESDRLGGLARRHAMQPGCSGQSQPLSAPPVCIVQETCHAGASAGGPDHGCVSCVLTSVLAILISPRSSMMAA